MGVTATGARAGVWTPDAGSAYQRLAFNFFRNDASFSAGRDRREGFKEFTNTNLTYYLEDGIRDGLAFFGSLPAERLTHRTKGRNEVETFGFGDVNLGLRYRLWNRGVVFSTQFLFKAPYLYDRRDRLPLGNRQEDFHLRRGSDRTLGATLVAAHAGEMISELTLAMVGGLGLGKIAATIHPYPTQAEVVKRAGDAYNRTRLTPTVRRLFERCERPRNEGAGAGIQRSWGGGSHGPARRRREGCASSLQRGSPDPGTRALLSDLVRSRLARGDS